MKIETIKRELAFYADITPTNTTKAEFDDCITDCVDIVLSGLTDFAILYHGAIPYSDICADLHKALAHIVSESVTAKVKACREIMKAIHTNTVFHCSDIHLSVFVFCRRFRPFDAQFAEVATYAESIDTASMGISAESYIIETREKPIDIFEQLTDSGYTHIHFNDGIMIAYARTENEKDIIFTFTR